MRSALGVVEYVPISCVGLYCEGVMFFSLFQFGAIGFVSNVGADIANEHK